MRWGKYSFLPIDGTNKTVTLKMIIMQENGIGGAYLKGHFKKQLPDTFLIIYFVVMLVKYKSKALKKKFLRINMTMR